MIAVCAVAAGTSVIEDTIYLDRFTHVPDLARMGAQIELRGNVAVVKGVDRLAGAQVMATEHACFRLPRHGSARSAGRDAGGSHLSPGPRL
jgi:UDP-N-acetylglucosamine 1-carboxyvinyltransferase